MEPANFQFRASTRTGGRAFISSAVLVTGYRALFLAAICSATPALASHEETAVWRLVKERCSLCHYLNRQDAKFAPSLQDLFKRQTLRNGKPVNDQTVSEWIAEGSANMPSFKNTLTPEQIRSIVNYLKDHPPLDPWR
jgi:mono/diheme cytochrome c family protein